MSDNEDWGPWVDHDGRGCPLPVGARCWIKQENGVEGEIRVELPNDLGDAFCWSTLPDKWRHCAIIRYRVRRPKALRDLIELVETLPAPAPQPERVDA